MIIMWFDLELSWIEWYEHSFTTETESIWKNIFIEIEIIKNDENISYIYINVYIYNKKYT